MLYRKLWGAVFAVPLVLVASTAVAQKAYGPGVSDTEIKLGSSAPLSGPASGFSASGKAVAAYFQYVNDKGGINGRKVDFTLLDNAYNPPKAVEATRRLVEDIGVLAEVATVGTVPSAAVQKYLNGAKVPQLFISAGGRRFNDPKNFPWTIPLFPGFETEGAIIAKYVLATKPDAKIALLYQNDDYGKDYMKGFREKLGAKASQIIAEQSYELASPNIDSQILLLKSSGADVLIDQSSPKFAAQAIRRMKEIGWTPLHILGGATSSVEATLKPAGLENSVGLISTYFLKQAADPDQQSDPEVIQFRAFLEKYLPGVEPSEAAALAGYLDGQAIELVLRKCGDNLTRENLIKQASTLKGARVPMLLPGITFGTSPDDYTPFPILRTVRFNGQKWVVFGDPVSAD